MWLRPILANVGHAASEGHNNNNNNDDDDVFLFSNLQSIYIVN